MGALLAFKLSAVDWSATAGAGMHSLNVKAHGCRHHIQQCTCLLSQASQLFTLCLSHEIVHSKDRWVQVLNVRPRMVQIDRNEVCCKVASKLCVIIKITLSGGYATTSCVLGIDGGNVIVPLVWYILVNPGFWVGSVRFG